MSEGEPISEFQKLEQVIPVDAGFSPQGDLPENPYVLAPVHEMVDQEIETTSEKPKLHSVIDSATGIYTDESGEQWGSKKGMGKKKYSLAMKNLENFRTLEVKLGTRIVKLINLSDVANFVEPLYALPQAEPETDIYSDPQGEQWAIFKYFGGRDIEFLKKNQNRVRTIKGRSHKGMRATLYNLNDAMTILQERDVLPQVDSTDSIHSDNLNRWASHTFFNENEISYLREHKDKIRTISGRGKSGEVSTLYNLEDAQRILRERDIKPQTGLDGIYRDEIGEWAGATTLGPADYEFIKRRKEKVRTIEGRNISGGSATLFNLDDVRRAVAAERTARPQVDTQTGIYSNHVGDWVGYTAIGHAEYQYIQKFKKQIRSIKGRNASGAPATLFHLDDVRRILSERPSVETKATGYWKDPVIIENEARSALAAGIDIGYSSLKRAKLNGLLNAIPTYYPGKMRALRDKLGLSNNEAEKIISPDEADEFMRSFEIEL